MKNYRQFVKGLPSKTVVFAFGRFNPPTIGHELLVKAVKKLAVTNNAAHAIYASKSQDAKKNPLTVDKKVHYLNIMFPGTNFVAANQQERTFIEALKHLNKTYKNLIMVAGSDRIPEYEKILNKYNNGTELNFDSIQVVSAGQRDPDADDASGMSASKMRAVAAKGDYSTFKRGLPSNMREIDGRRLMNDVRQGMGLDIVKEQIVLVKDDLREQYFRGEIFNEGDLVESDGQQYTIAKRGSNHLLLKSQDGELVSKWLHDVKVCEEKQEEEMSDDINEELTNKTLKSNDKIKVARVIATMLGVDNAESSSNAENLVNMGLRKIRTKSLNAETVNILSSMLALAKEVGIKYDESLKPSKIKESSDYTIAQDVLRFNDFKKLKKMNKEEEPENDSDMDAQVDPDHEKNETEVGGLLVPPYPIADDNLRRRKVKYHLGEQTGKELGPYEKESGHENTAQHVMTAPPSEHSHHTKKEKRLAKSFIDRMNASVNEEALDEVSSQTLDSYKEKAKKSADSLTSQGKHKKAADRWMNVMKATGKQIEKTTKDIHNALHREEAEMEEDEDLTPEELENICAEIQDWEDVLDAYEPDEIAVVDDETGEEVEEGEEVNEEALNEVLSRAERIRAKIRFAKTKAKRQRSIKIALRKYSNSATINKRSRKLAVKLMKKRLLRGRDISKISVAEKERLEKTIQKRGALINRLAMKLAPRVRKIEKQRMTHSKFTKGTPSPSF